MIDQVMPEWAPLTVANATCNTTCGCFDLEPCPGVYDASADSPEVWTCVEVLVVIVLCRMQGLGPLDVPGRFFHRLRVALMGFTWADDAADRLLGGEAGARTGASVANAPRLLAAFTAGSVGLLVVGLRSGFLCRPPNLETLTSTNAFFQLPMPLVFPGLIEECFWRFMVLPAPDEAAASPSVSARKLQKSAALCVTAGATAKGWNAQHVLALAGFVAYHLDHLHFYPRWIFVDPRFIAMAAILGAACTDAAITTRTVWVPALFHGLWVWAWLACMGKCG